MIKLPQRLRKIEDEEWKEMPLSEGKYFISNYGRIKSFSFKKEGQIMKPCLLNGFQSAVLTINKKKKTLYIHKIVAEVWLEKPDESMNRVIHKDWNKTNNQISNLEWASEEHVRERTSVYLRKKYADPLRKKVITQSKLKEKDVLQIKLMIEKKVPNVVISKMFCISDMQVTRIKRGENWGHVQLPKIVVQ